ncbi:hypothetical protein OFO01_07275 [Campylobacter sp. JMF_01 NE2]|uniref:hypothetical protein n=1 Tax=unclassified Campylobacter TaxID=2593542 RepID=UPI0022E9FDB5|nr:MULTISPECIES: hypothetical protein [unclassified Campylobacter]MDA3053235.1 hypothetical protein [Campylobacter sp. JMF_03 NE3]MDA3067582.1 hypothetical protein [Campylobacter sp. JMF_01 NE2]
MSFKVIFNSDNGDEAYFEDFLENLKDTDEHLLADIQSAGIEKSWNLPDDTYQKFYEFVSDIKASDLEFYREIFDKELKGKTIILYGILGKWSGNYSAYKILGTNLKDIFACHATNKFGENEFEIYSSNRQIYYKISDHDGNSFFKVGIVDNSDLDKVTSNIYDNEISKATKAKIKSAYWHLAEKINLKAA